MKQLVFITFVLFLAFSCIAQRPLPKHWHESKGYGTSTKGGLGGKVYRVTNLNSGGAGSLAAGASQGNTLVVFEVGGVIKGGFKCANNVTIAGQTAPYPGITCVRTNLGVGGSDKVISHITIQYGTGGADACNVGGSNIVLDHVAVFWGRDETITTQGDNGVTLFKTICAEANQFTGHGDGEHSKGFFVKSPKKLAFIGCASIHNALRTPRVDRGKMFLGNHLVYNHGPGWDHQGPKVSSDDQLTLDKCPHCFTKIISGYQGTVTLVGSIALAGPDSSPRAKYLVDGHNTTFTAYLKDNINKDIDGNDLKMANTEGEFTGGASGTAGAVTVLDQPAEWPEGYEPLPAKEAVYEVIRTVGPHPGCRNGHLDRIMKHVAEGKGAIIDGPNEVGGWANYQPTTRKLGAIPDGVEARQAWLDSLEDEIAVDTTIDLSRLYKQIEGGRANDKLVPGPTSINNRVSLGADGFSVKAVQRYSRSGQLHVSFTLSNATSVSMKMFDLAGNTVLRQPNKYFKAGSNEIVVNVEHLPVGIYVCRFQIGNTMISQTYSCL